MGVRFLLLSVVLMSAYIALGQAQDTQDLTEQDILFNCNRFGQDCGNSGQCQDDGTCTCSSPFLANSCLYEQNNNPCVNITCDNGGVCALKDGVEACYCPTIHKGPECSEDRIEVKCVGENVVINIDLWEYGLSSSNFSGKVYLGLNNSDSSCTLTPDGVSPGLYNEQSFEITDETLCDGWKELFNDTVNDVEGYYYSKQLTIQFSPDYVDANDLTLNLTCFHSSDDTVVVSSQAEISVVADDGEVKEADDAIKVAYEPVEFGYFDSNGNDLSEDGQVVNVGDIVTFDLVLSDLDVYKSLAVALCTVSDEDVGQSLEIIENQCPTDEAKKLLEGPVITDTSTAFGNSYNFTIIRLTESTTTLTVECEILLCKDENDTRCEFTSCGGGARRRRRAAVDEDLDVQKTSAQITIASDEINIITSDDQNKECETPESTKISLISLAVVCVILLVVSLTLVYFLIQNRNAPAKSFP